MATQLKLRKGTTAEHAAFTGAIAEVTVDTDKDTLVVHDGATAGGFPLARASDITAGLKTADIGVTVQGYDADTTKNDVSNTFIVKQVITVTDNTNAALRITQGGTGNAFVVEDSANPDSTPFVIGSSGNVIIGHTAIMNLVNPNTGSVNAPAFENVATSIAGASSGSILYVNNAGQAGYYAFAKSRGATVGDMTTLQSGDNMGYLSWQGSDGTNFIRAADIRADVDGTPGTNDMPGRLVFSTTADGASAPTEKMRISSTGAINMAAASSLQKNSINAYTLKNISYLTSGTAATYTTPTGVRALFVECVGGGGGGGGVDGAGTGTGAGGGGGGGGGCVQKLIINPSASYTYTIAAGGIGGAAGVNNGTVGGSTTFTDGTLTLTAIGGNGGLGLLAAATNSYYLQSGGGDGSGGDSVIGGQYGGARSRGNFGQYVGGYGGGSIFGVGSGGTGGAVSNGAAATKYGAGGGGGAVDNTTTNYAGGDGFQGVIRITEYY